MIEIIDGDVVVIRDGDLVEAVYYRQFYESISELVDQVIEYLNGKKFAEPNISFMQFIDCKLETIKTDSLFYAEFDEFARIFNFENFVCKDCNSLNFIFLDSNKMYCPKCRSLQTTL